MRCVWLVLAALFVAVSFRAEAAPPKTPQTQEEWAAAATARLNAKKRAVRNSAITPGKYMVRVRLAVLPDGRVVGVQMTHSSTVGEIDSAALRLVADVSPLPPLPPRAGFDTRPYLVSVPIIYTVAPPKEAPKGKARPARAARPQDAAAE